MVREFVYTSSNGTKSRKVFVIKENNNYIGGIDLNLLSSEDADTIMKLYKDVVPTSDFKTKITLEGFNPDWVKAYRQYSKSKIVNS
jgi:coproporphyrinogen III oxidase-like Fe-S oxidoreductase